MNNKRKVHSVKKIPEISQRNIKSTYYSSKLIISPSK